MEEIARGLVKSNCFFLWVVRAEEESKLPRDFVSEKGLIVNSCSQLLVLAHPAVGYFLTHCDRNSTLEALRRKKKLQIAIPIKLRKKLKISRKTELTTRGCQHESVEAKIIECLIVKNHTHQHFQQAGVLHCRAPPVSDTLGDGNTENVSVIQSCLSLNVGGGDSFLTVGSYNPSEFSSPAATEDFSEEQLPLYLGKYLIYEDFGYVQSTSTEVLKPYIFNELVDAGRLPSLGPAALFMAAKEIGALQVAKSKLEKEVEELTRQLQLEKCTRSGVHLVRGIVKDVQPQKIILSDGTDIPFGLLVWSTGAADSGLLLVGTNMCFLRVGSGQARKIHKLDSRLHEYPVVSILRVKIIS
ncbi:Glycosyltransferase [Forsythia ovata]|uniref:Glycosyltransferase n=1 Tax=Forsythia ovata TaxID=205694 RepID=A0ABD1VK13_9LAMI